MNITCPNCALSFPLAAGANEADARRVAAVMADLPPIVGRQLIEYLGMFKPPKTGLRWSRMLTVLQDIAPEITAAEVTRSGRTLPATAELWAEALRQMTEKRDKLTLPLKSNGYLREIVFGLADKAGAEAERDREQQLRQGQRPAAGVNAAQSRIELLSEIRAVEDMIAAASEPNKPALEKQLTELRNRLNATSGQG